MKKVYVLEFSEFPGPRNESIGPNSGEKFKNEVLKPTIKEYGSEFIVVLDGAYGYGSSFLDESFAGLIRDGFDKDTVLSICEKIVSEDDPSLKVEILDWVKEAIELAKNTKS